MKICHGMDSKFAYDTKPSKKKPFLAKCSKTALLSGSGGFHNSKASTMAAGDSGALIYEGVMVCAGLKGERFES